MFIQNVWGSWQHSRQPKMKGAEMDDGKWTGKWDPWGMFERHCERLRIQEHHWWCHQPPWPRPQWMFEFENNSYCMHTCMHYCMQYCNEFVFFMTSILTSLLTSTLTSISPHLSPLTSPLISPFQLIIFWFFTFHFCTTFSTWMEFTCQIFDSGLNSGSHTLSHVRSNWFLILCMDPSCVVTVFIFVLQVKWEVIH